MPSRSQMDTPATVMVVVVGVVLILASVPFLGGAGGGATDYLVAWSDVEAASDTGSTGAAGSEQTIQVAVEDVRPSNAVIELTACNDGAQQPVQQPATITWELQWESHSQTGTASCAQRGPFTVEVEPQPDVGSASGSSQADARADAYGSAGGNESVTFLLTYSWSRPSAPGGLPLPPPAFSATVSLAIGKWVATVNEAEEVPQ